MEAVAPQCPKVRHWLVMIDPAKQPVSPSSVPHPPAAQTSQRDFGKLRAHSSPPAIRIGTGPYFDENTAVALCYTSGTTGNPKGALYSHRSTVLHAYALSFPDAMCASARDVILPVVPMFHVNAWGIPFAAPLVGAKLVFPGPHLDGKSLSSTCSSRRA